MPFTFRKLKVDKKAVILATDVSNLTGNIPQKYYYLSSQFDRTILSAATNIVLGLIVLPYLKC